MEIPLFQVDAFTDQPFAGNPAAVCLLPEAQDDKWMQAVAAEMNLSETAFLLDQDNGYPASMVHTQDRSRSVRPCHAGVCPCPLE